MSDLSSSQRAGIVQRFVDLNLADCRLLRMVIEAPTAGVSSVTLQLELIGGTSADEWRPATLQFLRSAGLTARIDFWGKSVCDDVISYAQAEPLSEHKANMLDRNPRREIVQSLAHMLEFSIALCPPGGEFTVIAEDFTLVFG